MSITRRQFNKAAMALGLTWTVGGVLTSCGSGNNDGGEKTTDQPNTLQSKTLHFDLADLSVEAEHILHVGGRRHRLQQHGDATRSAARLERPGLHRVPDARLTHFAEAELSTTRVQRMYVTSTDPMRGPALVLVANHIPTEARIRARRARGVEVRPLQTSGGADCTLKDEVEDDYISGRSTAKSIITHHPDLVNLDPDTAAAIEVHMDSDQAAQVDILTQSICAQGPAYQHDPAYLDGWCVLVPMVNDDGSPLVDTNDQQIYDYQFSDQTSIDLKPAIEAILGSVKNDPSLEGEQYTVIYHGDPVDEDALPEANPPVLDSNEAPALTSGGGDSVTFSNLGYHHNVLFYGAEHSGRSFTLKILNLNFIWYGLYLEYLDADGEPLKSSQRSSFLTDLVAQGLDLETDTLKFWDILSSPPSVFGLPVPYPYQITVDLDAEGVPEGAASVRVNLIGPGVYGPVQYGPSIIPGAIMTGILDYAIPMYFVSRGLGEDESKTLIDLIKQKSILLKTLLLGAQIYSTIEGTNTNDLGVAGSLEGILVAMTKGVFLNLKSTIPELWDWLVAKEAEEEAEESTPFVGWVIRIMALLGTAGDIIATEAEIATNPIVIHNTVSFTHSVTVVVSHDPEDFEFPLLATHFQVQITAGTKAIEPPTVIEIKPEDRSNDTLTALVENVPATGSNATLSVIFLADNGYPLAHSAAVDANGNPVLDENGNRVPGDITFLNKLPASGDLVVDVPIVENPVPIDAETQYTHDHKLEYAEGRYQWNYTPVPPALEPPNCGIGNALCDLGNITVWASGGMAGYSWFADSTSIRDCRTGASGQLHNFQNISLKNDPNIGRKSPGCGFPGGTPLAYDARVPVGDEGFHFYLDPVRISDVDPEYVLRRLVLDDSTAIDVNTDESWGRFRIQIDRLAVYNKGQVPLVVGIAARFHKFSVLEVPNVPYIGDDFANNAKVMSAKGERNDGLLLNPTALTIADNGAILVLQGGATKSIKAFDFDGKPWKFFNGQRSSVLPLEQDAPEVTWLDISIEPTNLLYVLSFQGDGTQRSDYRLDVYDADTGERVVRNTGIAVGRIVVDKFRGLYSLNYETVKGSPVVEPSVSVWAPSPPPALAL